MALWAGEASFAIAAKRVAASVLACVTRCVLEGPSTAAAAVQEIREDFKGRRNSRHYSEKHHKSRPVRGSN